MKTTKHEKLFLAIDYDLLGITSVEVNGETHEVKLHHKIVYSYLQSLSGTFQQVTPSLTGIGKRLGLGTDQTVRRHIKDLVSFGWVQVVSEGRKGKTNIYIVLPYAPETQQEAPEEVPAPTMTKVIEEAVIIPERVTASTERVQAVDDVAIIETVCELLSKPDSLRQQSRGDTFINYARRVLNFNNKRLPSRLEEKLEESFESRFPHFYSRFGIPF
ncbi:TPA: helix-turn-helix domain-containing protein [Kluyvera georgiana]|nr:helix-turn-helix domain-containing protein [Enterobacter hormaechei]QLW22864.1 helix-turn-helix domain-containing protein [Enterobacter cloacae]HCU0593582.1 helix-turn-helix domain-containing protein [Enterobacter hormaechei]